jgi:TonB family protein
MPYKPLTRGVILLVASVPLGGTLANSRAAEPRDCGAPPTVVVAVAPSFPDVCRRARFAGVAIVVVEIDHVGKVESATFGPNRNANSLFNAPALEAAKQWQFGPAANCDSRYATLTFEFKSPVKVASEAGTVFRPPFTVEIRVEAVAVDADSTSVQ